MKKRWLSGLLCLTLVASGCGQTTAPSNAQNAMELPELAEFTQANSLDTLLKSHTSVVLSQILWTDGSTCHKTYFMTPDGDSAEVEVWNDYEAYCTDDALVQVTGGEVTAALSAESASHYGVSEFSLIPVYDEPPDITVDGDGNYILEASYQMDEEAMEAYGLSNGGSLVTTGVFDKDSLIALEAKCSIVDNSSGESTHFATYKITLDKEVVYPQKMLELQTGLQRGVTLVLSDGTQRSFTVPADVAVDVMLPQGQALYDDAQCTHRCQDSGIMLQEDATFYCK